MKRLYTLIIFLICYIMVIDYVYAERVVGVSPGDWTEYAITYSGNATLPPLEIRGLWMKVIVVEVSETNITFEATIRFADSAEYNQTVILDVETGWDNASMGPPWYFIGADLNQGDPIFTSGNVVTINKTIFKQYLGGELEVNVYNISTYIPETSVLLYSEVYYWNKATGALVEIVTYNLESVVAKTWLQMEVKMSAVIPEFPSLILLPLFVTVATLVVLVSKRNKVKSSSHS